MTLVARQARVLAFECISGLLVIEGLDVPLDERKIFSVVLGMTAGAILAGARAHVIRSMKPLVRGQARCDLGVTFQALERGGSTEFMAGHTVGWTAQGLVRPGKRARRDLRQCRARQPERSPSREPTKAD